ncbi:M23 family metallopeptidase [bacterium]|nr:M23 family metallopeptidase [bacterium]
MNRLLTVLPLLLVLLCAFVADATQPIEEYTNEGLRWPTDISRRITSTYGEYRADRFHAGLDFSINGSIGAPAYAIDNGHISRIKTTFNGYGRVIYFTLDSGDIAVYAHLDGFEDRIEAVVRQQQLHQGRYEIEYWPGPDELRYEKGDVVAYCGDTGAGAPHLHFELRTPRNEPYDPVMAGFYYKDSYAPYVRRVAIRPLDGDSEVEGRMESHVFDVRQGVVAPVQFYGKVGLSVQAHDFQQGGWSRLGVKTFEMYLDDVLLHKTVMDTFQYSFNRHSRLEFDYELRRDGWNKFRRMYPVPGNKLTLYDESLPGGIIDSREIGAGMHMVRFRVTDHRGNVGEATWPIEALHEPALPAASTPDSLPMFALTERVQMDLDLRFTLTGTTAELFLTDPDTIEVARAYANSPAFLTPKRMVPLRRGWYTRTTMSLDQSGLTPVTVLLEDTAGVVYQVSEEKRLIPLRAGNNRDFHLPEYGLSIHFNGYGLPWDMVAELTVDTTETGTDAPVFTITPNDYPFLTTFEMTFDSQSDPFPRHALMVYREHDGQRWNYLSNERAANGLRLIADVLSFESFSVAQDTIPPELYNLTPNNGAAFKTRKPLLAARIRDTFSGLDMAESGIWLDGEEVIWVYDPDAARIEYRPWESLSAGRHEWRIVAADNAGNRTEYTRSFVID